MQKRVEWVDIAKGIAIICVVAGHAGNSMVTDFVYLFHLSVFIFLSGYFYSEEFDEHPFRIFPKRLKKLYLMYFGYEVIFLLARGIFFRIGWYMDGALYSGNTISQLTGAGMLKELLKICIGMGREPLIGAMWFVVMLMMIQIMYVMMRAVLAKVHMQKYATLAAILVFIMACVLTRVWIFIPRFTQALFGLVFYHVGFEYRKRDKTEEVSGRILAVSVITAILLFVAGQMLPMGYSVKAADYPVYFIITSLFGIFVVVCMAKCASGSGGGWKLLAICLKAFGKHSFDIMVLHFCAFKIVSIMIIWIYGLDRERIVEFPIIQGYPEWAVVYTVLGIVLPLGIGFGRMKLQERMRNVNR